MKKRISLLIILVLLTNILTACTSSKAKESNLLKVGIIQYIEHQALDDVKEGFTEGLKSQNIDAEIIYQNAHGDFSNIISICQKFVRDEVDLIFAIGTPAAQGAKQVTNEIPILFSAVTDPVDAGLVESFEKVNANITGTSDMADVDEQLSMFHILDKKIETIGILYNSSESNSLAQLKEVEKIAPKYNLKVKAIGISNINDVNKAMASLIKNMDAMYILSDNLTASAIGLISNKLIEENIISISAEESQVAGGVLITKSHSYLNLGLETSELAKRILIDKEDINDMPVYLAKEKKLIVNNNTLQKLDFNKDTNLIKEATILDN